MSLSWPDTANEPWNQLDDAAISNLTVAQFRNFQTYKAQLKADGHAWEDDAETILRGHIWGEIGD